MTQLLMIQIRRFCSEDQKAVRGLINRIMEDEFREEQSAYPTQDIDRISDSYNGLGEAFFVAERDKRIVGTVAIKKEDGRVALLRRLFVLPELRGQQIGSKLIFHAVHFCDEMGYDEVVFRTTSRMAKAAKACERCGFVQRAKLQLGKIEIMKFVLSLSNEKVKKSKS